MNLRSALSLMASVLSGHVEHVVHVSPDGVVRTVAAGVAAARPGDTVRVHAGVYREPRIVVDKAVVLIGDSGAVIDGEGQHELIAVVADAVTIRGLTLRNVGTSFVEDRAAIRISHASHCDISHNEVRNAFFGIYLADVTDCRVTNNTIRGHAVRETEGGNGIHLWTSRRVIIADNEITGHRDGMYFEFVHDSDVQRNVSTRNLRYGLHFMYSDGCRYVGNVFSRNGSGVAVMYTKGVTMTDNRFENNWGAASYGLLLKEISDARLEHNTFSHNTVGLLADGANRIVATRNQFMDNGWALRIDASTVDGAFTRNNFSGNSFDVASNSRSPSTKIANNFWDDYRGFDLDRDGNGDVPYHPVSLFSVITQHHAAALVLMRSSFTSLLDAAERVIPSLTPEFLVDSAPSMRRIP